MNENRAKKISKSLSFWLRHNSQKIGIELQDGGWVDINELIDKATNNGVEFTFDELKYVVDNNDKKRFSISDDLLFVRAVQGHSVAVDLKFEEAVPPQILYHGAPVGVIDAIMKEGLSKMSRHHCHLSKDIETSKKVANRRSGEKVILRIEAMRMRADGYKIYISENGVYLVDEVPSKYISVLETYK